MATPERVGGAVRWLEPAVFGMASIGLVLGAAGGPGWGGGSTEAVLVYHLERSAAAPLYDLLAGGFVHLPFGEPGFRIAVLGALLGAVLLAGVVAAGRALVPRDPVAGAIGALLLALAPPLHDADGPALLAAAGAVWAVAAAADHARTRSGRTAAGAMLGAAIVLGAQPWLGVGLIAVIAAWTLRQGAPRNLIAATLAGIGALAIVLWIGALGSLPGAAPSLAAVLAASGRGAATIVLGVGLVGVGFGALTGLAAARWLASIAGLAIAHAVAVDHGAVPLLALLAVAAAIIPSAIVRVIAPRPGWPRHLIALAAGVPLVAAAVLAGPALAADDPGAAPAQLASDLIDGLPPGPGVLIETRDASWFAVHHEQVIAGARPDLALAPPLPPAQADVEIVQALRTHRIAGADVDALGRLDPARARPRRRGFQLLGEPPERIEPVPAPPHYASANGAQQVILVELARAEYEAANGRLGAAARAAGLAERFGAADLAVLAASPATRARPALFGFVPQLEPTGPWLLELFGDDLAWVAGIPSPVLPPDAPASRRLHARWRAILGGKATSDDPEIAALGSAAVTATVEMLRAVRP